MATISTKQTAKPQGGLSTRKILVISGSILAFSLFITKGTNPLNLPRNFLNDYISIMFLLLPLGTGLALFAARKRTIPATVAPYQGEQDRKAGLTADSSGVLLGFRNGEPRYYGGDRHLVTFGPTGSGKNATVQTPALLEYQGAALVIDPKGQLCAITARQRAGLGLVRVLNPYAVLGIPTATYNPISHLDPHSPKFTVDCERIAEGLVSTPKKDHWEISALDAVAVIIKWVKLYGAENGFPVNLLTVRRLVQLPPERRLDFFQTMATCGNASLEERAGRYASDRPEVQDCFGTAQREMSFLYDEGIEKVFVGGKDEISFKDLKRRNDTYFLIIEPDALKERGKFLRLLVVSALGELYRETRKPEKPVLFMLDEFAQLGKLSFVEDAASIAREYQIKFWFILQNLTKLRDLYGKGADSILAAAGAVQGLAFTPNDMETANYFSERSGVKTVMKTAFTRSGGTSASNSGSSSSQGWSESRHEVKEPRYTVQELFELGENSQLLICPNVAQSLDLNRFPYFEGTRYTGLYEVDPYHMENGLRKAFEERARAGYFHVSLKAPIFTPPHIWPSELLFDPDDYKPPFVKCGACGALSSFWVWNQKDACPKCEKDIPPVGYCVEYPKA